MHMYVHMNTCVYMCIFIHLCICTHMYICMYAYIITHVFVNIYQYIYTHTFQNVHGCVYVCECTSIESDGPTRTISGTPFSRANLANRTWVFKHPLIMLKCGVVCSVSYIALWFHWVVKRCSVLLCVAVCCSVVVCCSVLQTDWRRSVLQYIAVWFNALQFRVVCCGGL